MRLIPYSLNNRRQKLFAWGSGNAGQLGIGAEVLSMSLPTQITQLDNEEIINLKAASDITAVVTSRGEIYTWGRTRVIIASIIIYTYRMHVWGNKEVKQQLLTLSYQLW